MFDGYTTSFRHLMWTPVQWPGCEHLVMRAEPGRIVADGAVIAMPGSSPIRLNYRIECDSAWRTERVDVTVHGQPPVNLVRRDDDRWFTSDGTARHDLSGCIDVDIALTPFTNTLPIRRLGLATGGSAALRMVYVQVDPLLEIHAADQRYARLPDGGYRYQSGSFTADLEIDTDGFVTRYPNLWELRRPAP